MNFFDIIAILITLTAGFTYVNFKYIHLPMTIGVMAISLLLSVCLIAFGGMGFPIDAHARTILTRIDFDHTLLYGMLSYLLFAGALHINLEDLAKQKWIISLLATFGVLISTLIIGIMSFFLFQVLKLNMPLIYCFLFGALISPTDPIAVLGILKNVNAPKSLETKISGESLFNDGIAVVVFLVLLEIATGGQTTVNHIVILFIKEAIGGLLLGLFIGWIVYRLLMSVNNYHVEILLTLALVTGGYALAMHLHLSGPIFVVVAGLFIGNHGRLFAMSEETRIHLDTFWELIDEILNAVLFVLIGLELLVLTFKLSHILAGVIAIPLIVGSRLISVGFPIAILRTIRTFSPNVVKILTWGGVRGGISVALALTLPPGPFRDLILVMTYIMVIFSILVQGLTIEKLMRRLEE